MRRHFYSHDTMSNRPVLVDSSAWINYLIGHKEGIWDSIGGLLQDHRAATNEVIRMEVLTGAKDETQYAEITDQFEGMHFLPVSGTVWKHAERLRFDLRCKGHLVPLADAVIASCAVVYDCELLHADRHFDLMSRHTSLKIFHS